MCVSVTAEVSFQYHKSDKNYTKFCYTLQLTSNSAALQNSVTSRNSKVWNATRRGPKLLLSVATMKDSERQNALTLNSSHPLQHQALHGYISS